ncbi:hypothetical protein GCM10027062_40720 [Nocardioides hungaricus]
MNQLAKKLRKAFWMASARALGKFHPRTGSNLSVRFYARQGLNFAGEPTYVASDAWFDGTDGYRLITLSEGCNISSGVRILTHDWSPFTALRGLGGVPAWPVGKKAAVVVGPHAFIGLGAILLPGSTVGEGAVIGAGAVVRGEVPPHSIAIGNPATIINTTREFLERQYPGEYNQLPGQSLPEADESLAVEAEDR